MKYDMDDILYEIENGLSVAEFESQGTIQNEWVTRINGHTIHIKIPRSNDVFEVTVKLLDEKKEENARKPQKE
jgi:hypothetical protein